MSSPSETPSAAKLLAELGAKPSTSEEHGLAQIRDTDRLIFSPGISTAGFAEIRMAQNHPDRKIVATTIDQKGLDFARQIIAEVGLEKQIETRLEDLRNGGEYPEAYFDFIYARLVLHYLSAPDLDQVLTEFYRTLKPDGRLFIVVRSIKNIPLDQPDVTYEVGTKMTSIPHYLPDGTLRYLETRYFHSRESIVAHLERAGFTVLELGEYQEHLYRDFMRQELSDTVDHVIEVKAKKPEPRP